MKWFKPVHPPNFIINTGFINTGYMNYENFNNGFILLSRSLPDSFVFKNEKILKVWLWCIIKAAYKQRVVPIHTKSGISEVELQRGQFIFGRKSASKELDFSESSVYRMMQKLKTLKKIEIESNNHFSIITVCNYTTYNDVDNYKRTAKRTADEQQTNSRRTADEQQTNTNNKVNKLNNVYKGETSLPADKKNFFSIWVEYRERLGKPLNEISKEYIIKDFEQNKTEIIEDAINYAIKNGRENLTYQKEKSCAKKENEINEQTPPVNDESKYDMIDGWNV